MKVFTNGCFDILHFGHIELLKYCKSFGQVIVGINSDDSVKRLKGVGRPINPVSTRIEMLKSLKYVDEVHVFDEDTPYSLIQKVAPDLIVKGGDYTPESVVGRDLAQVLIFDYKKGFSTSSIIAKLGTKVLSNESSHPGLRVSEIHNKGWGYEEWLVNNELYCGKILYFLANRRCSFHFHKLKTETFYVLSGRVKILFSLSDEISSAEQLDLSSGSIFHVPIGLRHQIQALEESRVLEVSTQHIESDSYRVVKGD